MRKEEVGQSGQKIPCSTDSTPLSEFKGCLPICTSRIGGMGFIAFECSICHYVIVRNDGVLEIQEGESQALGCADVYWLILAPVTLCLHMWW